MTQAAAGQECHAKMECHMEQIGNMAGVVWHYLKANGPVSASKLIKEMDGSRDIVMQSVGWLAREGKLTFVTEAGKQRKFITLKE